MLKNPFITMILSAFCFAVMGAAVKLSGDLPLFEKVFVRNLIMFFLILFSQQKNGYRQLLGKKGNRGLLFGRAFFGLLGVICYFYALDHLLLADAAILNKLSPFFVTLLAPIFLKEKKSHSQILFLLLAFMGTLLVIKPKFDVSVLPALVGVGCALFAGSSYLFISRLGQSEESATIIFWFSGFSILTILPFLFFDFKIPTVQQTLFLLLTGLAAAGGQYFLTLSYACGKATDVSVYSYIMVIFSGILGFFIWHEVPDWLSLVGMSIIILSSVGLYHNKKKIYSASHS